MFVNIMFMFAWMKLGGESQIRLRLNKENKT